MDNLKTLEDDFKRRRLFECSHTKVEVDGVFVRVPEDTDSEDWQVEVIDGQRYVRIRAEDVLQDPAAIRSARVSTDRDTTAVNEKAIGLIKYLWNGSHVSPFEGGVIFRLKHTIPIAYAQPLFRLFASFNELSGRYSGNKDAYYMPSTIQGRAREIFERSEVTAKVVYQELLDRGVANEMARFAHLYRFYTKFFMTISLRHMMEFVGISGLATRHNQTEFWDVQDIYREIIKHWTPWAYQALIGKPARHNFLFVEDILGEVDLAKAPMSHLRSESVLNMGIVRLLSVSGDEDMMLARLDDFPIPLRAFGHGTMTFYIKMPIFVFRQWVRHRYGTFSEPTVDYDRIVDRNEFYVPEQFRKQIGHVGNYTYSDMGDGENNEAKRVLVKFIDHQRVEYRMLRNLGVPAEMAAMNLPYCFFIPVYWTVTLESLMNYFSLRVDSHAQAEKRKYAEIIWKMCSSVFPRFAKIFAQNIYFGDQAMIKDFRP